MKEYYKSVKSILDKKTDKEKVEWLLNRFDTYREEKEKRFKQTIELRNGALKKEIKYLNEKVKELEIKEKIYANILTYYLNTNNIVPINIDKIKMEIIKNIENNQI